jgi:hypothetical protein
VALETEVLARQKEVTDRISTQVRTLSVSFLAVVWLFLVPGKDGAPVLPHAVDKQLLIAAGAAALLAMVFDFLQYFASYLTVKKTLEDKKAVEGKPGEFTFEYDYNLIRYQAQTWFFWGKQILLAMSFAGLVRAFCVALFG